MTSQQVKYFLMLAKHLNFTKTAELLHVTQPVISRQLSALEKEIGFPLIVRSKHHVELSPAGELFYAYFSQAQESYGAIWEQAARKMESDREHISVALLDLFDNRKLLSAIGAFPNAVFRVERYLSPCKAEDLRSGRYDVGITWKTLVEGCSDLSYYELESSRDYLLISTTHPKGSLLTLSPKDIKSISLVSDDGKSPANFSAERLRQCELSDCAISLRPNLSSVLAEVESGLTATIIQSFSLSFLRFPHRAIPLDSWHSVGIVWRNTPRRQTLEEFVSLCTRPEKQASTNCLM